MPSPTRAPPPAAREQAIQLKQRERHEMRKAAREAQRALDDAAAHEEELVGQYEHFKRREQQTQMALELTKQEAKRRSKAATAAAEDLAEVA